MLDEERESTNSEPESSGDEDHSIGWLEVLAEQPRAIWDQTSRPAPDVSQELPPQPIQDSDQTTAGFQNQETVDRSESKPMPEGTLAETVSNLSDTTQDRSNPEEQGKENGSGTTSGWSGAKPEAHELGDEVLLENDNLMWLDEMDTVPRMNSDAQQSDPHRSMGVPGEEADEQTQGRDENEAVGKEPIDLESDEVPEDPDEAVAWLERLAARQGVPSEELPTVQSVSSPKAEMAAPAETGFGLPEEDAGEIPEDPDEAMAWLERLASRQGVDPSEMTAVQASEELAETPPSETQEVAVEAEMEQGSLITDLDEALDWLEELTVQDGPVTESKTEALQISVSDEPPTPAVAHDVEEAMHEAELLFTGAESATSAEAVDEDLDESLPEDGEDALAWLEQLAARQGAPIEELSTFEEEGITGQVEPDMVQDSTAELGEQIESARVLETPDSEKALTGVVELNEATADDELAGPPVAEPVEGTATEEKDSVAPEDVLAEDLGWLDTLGDVDAESWLESEGASEPIETASEPVEELEIDTLETTDEEILETRKLAIILPEVDGADDLVRAREAMQEGAVEGGLAVYSALVESGQSLPFVIDDLEIFYEEQGPEPRLQRVLGDAYARNGQLQRALRVYREALDSL